MEKFAVKCDKKGFCSYKDLAGFCKRNYNTQTGNLVALCMNGTLMPVGESKSVLRAAELAVFTRADMDEMLNEYKALLDEKVAICHRCCVAVGEGKLSINTAREICGFDPLPQKTAYAARDNLGKVESVENTPDGVYIRVRMSEEGKQYFNSIIEKGENK